MPRSCCNGSYIIPYRNLKLFIIIAANGNNRSICFQADNMLTTCFYCDDITPTSDIARFSIAFSSRTDCSIRF